jgi:hypothetical protein
MRVGTTNGWPARFSNRVSNKLPDVAEDDVTHHDIFSHILSQLGWIDAWISLLSRLYSTRLVMTTRYSLGINFAQNHKNEAQSVPVSLSFLSYDPSSSIFIVLC